MKTEKYELIRTYYDNGQLYYEEYHLNGELHNINAPASKGWYKNGQLSYKVYRTNGKLHNTTGPAYIGWHKDGKLHIEYWLNDAYLTKEQFENRKNDCIDGKVVEIEGKKYTLKAI